MHFRDHEPPHFHAQYGSYAAEVRVVPIGLLAGELPPRPLALVVEWATLHQAELLENGHRLRRREAPIRIAPLE